MRLHRAGGKPSPHKPLVLLYAISALQKGKNDFLFESAEKELVALLDKYGPGTVSKPEYPFVRLVSDGIWELRGNITWLPNKDYSKKQLREGKVRGGFTKEVIEALQDKRTLEYITRYLLGTYFPKESRTNLIADLRLTLSEP